MIDSHELQPIDEQHFLELVGHAQLVAAVARLQLLVANPNIFIGVRLTPHRWRDPVAHLAAAHEVGDELETGAIPGKQEWARGRLPIEFGDRKYRRAGGRRGWR